MDRLPSSCQTSLHEPVWLLYCYTDILQYCYTDILQYCYTDILLYCYTDILQYCYTDILLYCYTDILQYCYADILQYCYTDILLYCYTDILPPVCAVDLSNQYHIIQLRPQLGFVSDPTRGWTWGKEVQLHYVDTCMTVYMPRFWSWV